MNLRAPTTPSHQPLAVSLFAGVGGLDLGISATGFQIALAVEKDPHTAAQYQINFPDTPVLCADISQLSGQEIRDRIYKKYPNWNGEIGLVCGGPPCQGFSRIGKRDPLDPRNQLITHFVRLVGELQPDCSIMENVAGLKDERYSELVNNTLSQWREFNYTLSEWRLNAADYGVPQCRERMFWVGSRHGNVEIPATVGIKTTLKEALADLAILETRLTANSDIIELPPETKIGTCAYARQLIALFAPQHSTRSGTLQGCSLTRHNDETRKRFSAVAPGDKEPISRFPRLAWDSIAPTLRAGTGSDKGRHTAPRPIHPEHPRVITVREAARLHSFPDWFQFHPTKWRGFRQIGNAVPPLLALAVGKQIFHTLAQSDSNQLTQNTPLNHCLEPNLLGNGSNSINSLTHSSGETAMSAITSKLTYTFDYSCQFKSPTLEKKAQDTLSNFLGFVRHTFDGLVENGSSLWDIYYDCIACLGKKEGKKAFDHWLDSDDFCASRYIAQAAMEISQWFKTLPVRVQKLIQNNVQKWSVTALKQLTKVSVELVKQLIRHGKQTAASIKKAAASSQLKIGSRIKVINGRHKDKILTVLSDGEGGTQKVPNEWGYLLAQFADGLKTKLHIDDIELYSLPNSNPNAIFANPTLVASAQDWQKIDNLYQLEPDKSESLHNLALIYALEDGNSEITLGHIQKAIDNFELKPISNSSSPYKRDFSESETLTATQLEEKIAAAVEAALVQREREREEENLAKFQEIRDAALAAAKAEIQAVHQRTEKLAEKATVLEKQLEEKDATITSFAALKSENRQLQQRVADLEKALVDANTNRWANTFTQQAAKVINTELEMSYQPLVSKLEHMSATIQQQAQELDELRTYTANSSLSDERNEDIDTLTSEFGEAAESFGIPGWSRRGYRTADGALYTGLSAIKVFSQYAASLNNENAETAEDWCFA